MTTEYILERHPEHHYVTKRLVLCADCELAYEDGELDNLEASGSDDPCELCEDSE